MIGPFQWTQPADGAGTMRDVFEWGKHLPALEAPRVTLRALTMQDAPALFSIFGDPAIMRYWSSPALPDIGGARDLVRNIQAHFEARTLFQWGVELRSEHVVIGTCTLHRLDRAHRRSEVGYALGRAHWGQGLMAEGLAALIEFAFETLDLHRLEADVDPRNERSIRALERHGFQREGLLRERYYLQDEIQDSLMLGLLRRDWRARHAAPR